MNRRKEARYERAVERAMRSYRTVRDNPAKYTTPGIENHEPLHFRHVFNAMSSTSKGLKSPAAVEAALPLMKIRLGIAAKDRTHDEELLADLRQWQAWYIEAHKDKSDKRKNKRVVQ